MKKPPAQSRRYSRKRFADKQSLANGARSHEKWHNRLTLIVSACASIAAIVGVWVGLQQVQQMNLARSEANRAAIESGRLEARRTDAETKQATAQSSQAQAITSQLEVSRNQAISSEAQARSMQSLALASQNQASSLASQSTRMGRLATAAENQYELQNSIEYEASRAKFDVGFDNVEMNSTANFDYDPTKPYTISYWIRNIGSNSASLVYTLTPLLLKSGEIANGVSCLDLKCSPVSPAFVRNGVTVRDFLQLTPISIDPKVLVDQIYLLYVILRYDYQDRVFKNFDKGDECRVYSFTRKRWTVCGSRTQ